jgi:tetratricopeptide (TPR) repeat protein
LLLVVVGCWVFWPALHGGMISDDDLLVTFNPDLRSLSGLGRIWFARPSSDYWPLTWSLLWGEWHLWGNHPLGYHLCNLLLHLFSGCLIWQLLARLGMRWGWAAGLLFVVHPLTVESVAWISEIKNTLSLPLFLLSVDHFIVSESGEKKADYWWSFGYYVAAMLSKTSVVMLPVVLLLYLWWRKRTVSSGDFYRLLPFFAVALAFGVITLHFQTVHTPLDPVVNDRGLITRVVGAGVIAFFYLGKFFFPVLLLPTYERWSVHPLTLLQIATIPALVFGLGYCWANRASWGRHALLGFGFFLVNLAPVVGILNMALMNITWVADHLVYLPMIGLVGISVAALELLSFRHRSWSRGLEGVLVVLLVACACGSHGYAGYFVNEETLWRYAIRHNPTSWDAHTDLGNVLLRQGRTDEGLVHFQTALKLRPELPQSHNDVADALMKSAGGLNSAIAEYEEALRLDSYYPKAEVSLGLALLKTARKSEATAHFQRAVQLDPDDFRAHYSLANALAETQENHAAAIAEYHAALALNPEGVDARNNLGGLLAASPGHREEAIRELRSAIRLKPDFAPAHYNLAFALAQEPSGVGEAIGEYEAVIRIKPGDRSARYQLARLLADVPGRTNDAIAQLRAILSIDPGYAPARRELDLIENSGP